MLVVPSKLFAYNDVGGAFELEKTPSTGREKPNCQAEEAEPNLRMEWELPQAFWQDVQCQFEDGLQFLPARQIKIGNPRVWEKESDHKP